MSDGSLGGQISPGRGCVHSVQRGGQLWADLGLVPVSHTCVHGWGGGWPKLFSFLSYFFSCSVCSLCILITSLLHLQAAKHVGQEKLSYCMCISNTYCLYCDNARSCYQSVVILNILQIENKEVPVQCHLCLAHCDTGWVTLSCHCILGCFLSCPHMGTPPREPWWLHHCARFWTGAANPGQQSCQPAATKCRPLVCH